jgi:hypothetical protein
LRFDIHGYSFLWNKARFGVKKVSTGYCKNKTIFLNTAISVEKQAKP